MKFPVASLILMFLPASASLVAQTASITQPSVLVPRLVRFGGTIKDASGNPLAGTISVTFSLYSEQTGGTPLWQETQKLTFDANGRYRAMLGSTQPNGVPLEPFSSGQARWLGVQPTGLPEQPRALLVSVPYALKAAEAETLAGLPPSAFVLAAPSDPMTAGPLAPSFANRDNPSLVANAPSPDYGNGVIYASTLTGTGNGDIGDRVMQAYNQYCPATGCRIRIAPISGGGCWQFTTPITFSVRAKPVTLEGDPGGATCIRYTASTGTAVTLDWGDGPSSQIFGAGVRDITIEGPCGNNKGVPNCSGITAQGLVLGVNHANLGAFISNVNVGIQGHGFFHGIVNTGVNLITGYLTELIQTTAYGNAVGYMQNAASENTKWIGGGISENVTGVSITHAGTELTFELVSFDANTSCAISMTGDAVLYLIEDHFENPGLGSNCWLNGTMGDVIWQGGDLFEDVATGTAPAPITFSGTIFVFDHVRATTAGRGVPELINFTGNTSAYLTPNNTGYNVQPLDYIYSGNPGRVFYFPLWGPPQAPAKITGYHLSTDSITSNTKNAPTNAAAFLNLAPTDQIAWEKAAGGGSCNLLLGGGNTLEATCPFSGPMTGGAVDTITNYASISGNVISGSSGSFASLSVGGGGTITNSSNIVQYVGTITTTASASDKLSVTGLTSSSHCNAQATNSTAAALTGVYIAVGSGVTILYHPPIAGGTFSMFCSTDVPSADFRLSVSPSAITVSAGHSAKATLAVAPVNGFNQQVSFTCTGLPPRAGCSAASVVPNGSTVLTTLTITTTTASAELRSNPTGRSAGPLYAMLLSGFVPLGGVGSYGNRSRRSVRMLSLLAMLMLSLVWIAACGSGSLGTQAGASTVTVTASSGSLSHTTTIILTVQ